MRDNAEREGGGRDTFTADSSRKGTLCSVCGSFTPLTQVCGVADAGWRPARLKNAQTRLEGNLGNLRFLMFVWVIYNVGKHVEKITMQENE